MCLPYTNFFSSGSTYVYFVQYFINGRVETSKSTEHLPVNNPTTQELLCYVQKKPDELVCSGQGALSAFKSCRDIPIQQRQQIFFNLWNLIRDHTEELALINTKEQSKTLADAYGDVFHGLEVVEVACGASTIMMGETAENLSRHLDTYLYRKLLGVTAGICPFSFPAMVPPPQLLSQVWYTVYSDGFIDEKHCRE